jgi:tripartite-type tricarboxylate transporter receptor subunit TctC
VACCSFLTAVTFLSVTPAFAQFPERTVRIVVPFDAGGTVDAVARALANRLSAKWSVPVIVDQQPAGFGPSQTHQTDQTLRRKMTSPIPLIGSA